MADLKRARWLWVGLGLALASTACGSTEHNAGVGGANTGGAATGGGNAVGAATAGGGAGGAATGGGGAGGAAGGVSAHDDTYVLEFSEREPSDQQPGLFVSNETLAVALTRGPAVREFSRHAPGDFTPADAVLQYTRIGCTIEDPEHWIGAAALTPTPTPGTQLIRVTITEHEAFNGVSTAQQLADETCLSVRAAGTFQPFINYSSLELGDGSVEVAFDVSAASVDAFALFLPTYTRISRVSYTIPPP